MNRPDNTSFFRPGDRKPNQLRPLTLTPNFVQTAEGSVLVSLGNTRVLTNATIEQGVPGWLRNSGRGWVTAEYAMLPRSTVTRTPRESERGKIGGRTHEIQRLIGRSLRVGGGHAGARRAHGDSRLRRDPGRWRHAHRGDHRGGGGAGAGAECAGEGGNPEAVAAEAAGGGHVGGHRRRQRRCSTSATKRIRRPRWT